jgi:hypothetical protein
MRGAVLVGLACTLVISGCQGRTAEKLTPEQIEQQAAAHQASILTCERLLGRKLTDLELNCVKDEYKDGELRGWITAPLSETLKRRQDELNAAQLKR